MRTLARFGIAGLVGAVALIALAVPPAEASVRAPHVVAAVTYALSGTAMSAHTIGQLTAAAKPDCFYR
jgi:hypothetical protein